MASSAPKNPARHNRYSGTCRCGHEIDQPIPKDQIGDETGFAIIRCTDCGQTVRCRRSNDVEKGRMAIQWRGKGVIERRIEEGI